jgi:hypothetical protein
MGLNTGFHYFLNIAEPDDVRAVEPDDLEELTYLRGLDDYFREVVLTVSDSPYPGGVRPAGVHSPAGA